MASVDLDAKLAAEDRPTLRWRGRDWRVRTGIPLSVLGFADDRTGKSLAEDMADLVELIAAMLDTTADEIRGFNPDHQELGAVMDALDELLGLSPGESGASSGSSASGATRSRPTSVLTTGSTSPKRSTTTRRTSAA